MPQRRLKAMPPHRRKQKKQKQSTTAPLLPPDVDVEVSDEDLAFLAKHRQYAGFLDHLDASAITKHVLGLSHQGKKVDPETYYEKKIKRAPSTEDEVISLVPLDPVNVLPVKTLTGELQYLMTSTKKPNGINGALSLDDRRELVRKDKVVFSAPKVPSGSIQDGDRDRPDEDGNNKRICDKATNFEYRKEHKLANKGRGNDADENYIKENSSEALRSLALKEISKDQSRIERITEIKGQMAEIGTGILADPENKIQALKELVDLCHDQDATVVNFAMLSLFAIFKDLTPGYPIRSPTTKELEMQVSKEVRKLRDYERILLQFYQKYVQMLISSVKSSVYGKTALKCMCGLLEAIPHFNYRDSILAAVIPYMNSSSDICSALSCEAVRSLLINEGKHRGKATVEAVQLIADLVKINLCLLRPDTIQVLLALSFDDNLNRSSVSDSEHGNDVNKFKQGDRRTHKLKSKQEKGKKAKKHELAEKLREEVVTDFKEASVIPDESERRKLQTLTLSALFETYFRVLKTSLEQPDSVNNLKRNDAQLVLARFGPRPLLRPCLDGLGKFSHLISIDFMEDLLGVLQKLAASSIAQGGAEENHSGAFLTVAERLQCCIIAFRIVRSNFDALNIDLRGFYVHFYNLLLEYSPVRGENIAPVLAEALQVILWEGRQHDMQRVAAFIKRLVSLSLHLGSAETIAALLTVRHLLQRYRKCQNLLENDGGGGAIGGTLTVSQANGYDPDLSGALSSVLWEITLLHRHYHPGVAKLASQISAMNNSEDIFLATLSPTDAVVVYSMDGGGFRPAVQPPRKVIKRRSYPNQPGVLSEDVLMDDIQAVALCNGSQSSDKEIEGTFSSYFSVIRAIKENEELRKDLRKTVMCLDLHKEFKAERRQLKARQV